MYVNNAIIINIFIYEYEVLQLKETVPKIIRVKISFLDFAEYQEKMVYVM